MPRDDDRYDDDDFDDRPRRRGGVKAGGNTTLYVLLGVGLVGLLGCGGLILAIVIEARKVVKEIKEGAEQAMKAMAEPGPPTHRVTAAGLAKDYADEAAEPKYHGQSIRVDGVIEKVDPEFPVSVRLAAAGAKPTDPRVEVLFHANHTAAGNALKVGQTVSVVGLCEGREDIDPDDDEWPANARPKYLIRLNQARIAGQQDEQIVPDAADPNAPKADDGKHEKAPAPRPKAGEER